jgi:C4-dicarboxylate-specific signal transduction histidine kinase
LKCSSQLKFLNTEKINALINKLICDHQTQKQAEVKYSVHQLLDEVLSLSEDRFTLKHIAITKVYSLNDFELVFNRNEMILALNNIVINAIEAMDPDNGRLRLVTRSMADKYVISIEDNGCGISKKNLRNIFKPYYTNKKDGLGIGLSTTVEILRSNHVDIKVRSKEHFGTSVALTFQKNQN